MKHSSFFNFSILFIVIIFCCIFIPFYNYYPEIFKSPIKTDSNNMQNITISSNYLWPIPRLYKN